MTTTTANRAYTAEKWERCRALRDRLRHWAAITPLIASCAVTRPKPKGTSQSSGAKCAAHIAATQLSPWTRSDRYRTGDWEGLREMDSVDNDAPDSAPCEAMKRG